MLRGESETTVFVFVKLPSVPVSLVFYYKNKTLAFIETTGHVSLKLFSGDKYVTSAILQRAHFFIKQYLLVSFVEPDELIA